MAKAHCWHIRGTQRNGELQIYTCCYCGKYVMTGYTPTIPARGHGTLAPQHLIYPEMPKTIASEPHDGPDHGAVERVRVPLYDESTRTTTDTIITRDVAKR